MQHATLLSLALCDDATAAYRFSHSRLFDRNLLGVIKEFACYDSECYGVDIDEKLVFDKKRGVFYRVCTRHNDSWGLTFLRSCEKAPTVHSMRTSFAHIFGENGLCYSIYNDSCAILRHDTGKSFATTVLARATEYMRGLFVTRDYIYAVRPHYVTQTRIYQYTHAGKYVCVFDIDHPVNTIVEITDGEIYVHDEASSTVFVYSFNGLLRRKYPLPNDTHAVSVHANRRHILAVGISQVYLAGVGGVIAKKTHAAPAIGVTYAYQVSCGYDGVVYVTRRTEGASGQVLIANVGKFDNTLSGSSR